MSGLNQTRFHTTFFIEKGQRILQILQDPEQFLSTSDGEFLAECSLDLNDQELTLLCEHLFRNEFIITSIQYVLCQRRNWKYLLLAIGNTIAYPIPIFIQRLLTIPSFVIFLLENLNPSYATSNDYFQSNSLEMSIWIIANILQGLEGDIPILLEPIVPSLIQLLQPVFEGETRLDFTPNSISTQLQIRRDQSYLRNFRSLCAIFSKMKLRKQYPLEYLQFIQLLVNFPCLMQALIYEFSLGLEGKGIQKINFYPDSFHRALTVSFLTKIPEGLELLIQYNVIPLLTKSLKVKFNMADLPTILLWSRCLVAIKNIAAHRTYHSRLVNDLNINYLIYAASCREEKPKVPLENRKMAADIAVVLRLQWNIERLFWIAQLKPSQDCLLSKLPAVLIKPIMIWFILFTSPDGLSLNSVNMYSGYDRHT